MADIVYCYNDEVYFNLTNKCPCSCTFCRWCKDLMV